MIGQPKPASQWLQKITQDQNLESLSDLIINAVTGARRWFRSAILQPTLRVGFYNEGTEKFQLGDQTQGWEPVSDVSSTSLGTHTFTMAAGYEYWIDGMYTKNSTRAATGITLDVTHLGMTIQQQVDTGTGGSIQGENAYLIGQGGVDTGVFSPGNPQMASAGATFLITQGNFVGADVVEYGWFGRRRAV